MTMLDVGQGDCIYIRTESGKHYLYDAGSSSQKDTGTWQVIPFLKYQGVGHAGGGIRKPLGCGS